MPCEHSSQERFAGEPECLCVKPRMSVQVPAFREHNLVTVLRRKESSPSVFVSPVSPGGSMSKLKHAVSQQQVLQHSSDGLPACLSGPRSPSPTRARSCRFAASAVKQSAIRSAPFPPPSPARSQPSFS
jgi:hypothetical protein